jgi:hypothetical protein
MCFGEVTCPQAQLQKNIDDVRRQRENLQARVCTHTRTALDSSLRCEPLCCTTVCKRFTIARAQAAEEIAKRREIEIGTRSPQYAQ